MKDISLLRNHVFLLLGIVFVFFVLAVIVLPLLWGGSKQPIAFNHKLHADNGLECSDCHLYYEDHTSSGRPTLEVCAACHEEAQGESDKEKKIVEHVQSGQEIAWKRLYRVPEDVLFSHKRHVILGGIECSVCHGDIGQSEKPPSRPRKISMARCMKCHEKENANNDCIACHR